MRRRVLRGLVLQVRQIDALIEKDSVYMPVYRLSPVRGQEDNEHWQCSSIGATACWVVAESEDQAREFVMMATSRGRKKDSGKLGSALDPWTQRDVSECVEDGTKNVPPDIVITAIGQELPIKY